MDTIRIERLKKIVSIIAIMQMFASAGMVSYGQTVRESAPPASPRDNLPILFYPPSNAPRRIENVASTPKKEEKPEAVTAVTTDGDMETELIQERYPNGNIRLARELVLDKSGNFVNHGSWLQNDREGNLIAKGQYRFGKRHGAWVRLYSGKDAELFKTALANGFQAPFTSQATFKEGKLHGDWLVIDGRQRKVSAWAFSNGHRNGTSEWFYPDGRHFRKIVYTQGNTVGRYLEWNKQDQLVRDDQYIEGRQLTIKTTFYKGTKNKQSEGGYLAPELVIKTPDDWWIAKPATFGPQGDKIKHGKWTSWHPNGRTQQQGEFKLGLPVGEFTTWHDNGQVSIKGQFEAGKQVGRWIWRHPNGMRKTDGKYADASPSGQWLWWDQNGKLTHRADFSASSPKTKLPSIMATNPLKEFGRAPVVAPSVPSRTPGTTSLTPSALNSSPAAKRTPVVTRRVRR